MSNFKNLIYILKKILMMLEKDESESGFLCRILTLAMKNPTSKPVSSAIENSSPKITVSIMKSPTKM